MDETYMDKTLPESSCSTSSPPNSTLLRTADESTPLQTAVETPSTALPKTSELSTLHNTERSFLKTAEEFTPTTRFPNTRTRTPWLRTAVPFTPLSSSLQTTPVSTARLTTDKESASLQTADESSPTTVKDLPTPLKTECSQMAAPSSFKTPNRPTPRSMQKMSRLSYSTAIDLDVSDDWGLLDPSPIRAASRFSPYKKSCSDLKTAISTSHVSTAHSPATLTQLERTPYRSYNWSPKSFNSLKSCWKDASAQTLDTSIQTAVSDTPVASNETIPLEMAKKMQMLEEILILHGSQLDRSRDRLDILVDTLLRTIGMLNSAILKGQAQEEKIKALEEAIHHNNA